MFREVKLRGCESLGRCAAIALAVLVPLVIGSHEVFGGPKVLVIGPGVADEVWCPFLSDNGYDCQHFEYFPDGDPVPSLDSYEIVLVVSILWEDVDAKLADFLRSGKGVITSADVPSTLGISTDPIVQAWIGANQYIGVGASRAVTIESDAILGDLPVGTQVAECLDPVCTGLADTAGHPEAKVLARFRDGSGDIAILRNSWEGGQSVYLTGLIRPRTNPGDIQNQIILRAVEELTREIPAVSTWGLVLLILLLLTAATLILMPNRRTGIA